MAHSTFVRYRGIANNHLKPALGHRKLKDLTRAEVRRLYSEKGKELSPRSVDYVHVTLQKALSQAVRDDLIHRNVAAGERPRSSRQREEAKALSPTQARALLRAASGQRNEALYLVAIHTGLRQGELLGLKWTDVDLDAESPKVSVRRSLKVTENGLGFGPPKNKASRRSVPLNETAVGGPTAHRIRSERREAGSPSVARPPASSSPTAWASRWTPPTSTTASTSRSWSAPDSKAEGFTFHALRHTFASALFERGEHPKMSSRCSGTPPSRRRWTPTRTSWMAWAGTPWMASTTRSGTAELRP